MRVQTECPSCDRPITLIQIMSWATPNAMKCPSCKRPLKIPGPEWPWWVGGVMLGVIIGAIGLVWQWKVGPLVAWGVLLLLVVILELIASLVICNRFRFEEKPARIKD